MEPTRFTLTLKRSKTDGGEGDKPSELQLIVLLPDGRGLVDFFSLFGLRGFHSLQFESFGIQVCDQEQLARWLEAFSSLKEPMETSEDLLV